MVVLAMLIGHYPSIEIEISKRLTISSSSGPRSSACMIISGIVFWAAAVPVRLASIPIVSASVSIVAMVCLIMASRLLFFS